MDEATEASEGPRVAPYDGEMSKTVADIIELSKGMGDGVPLNIFTTMAHHGRALKHVFALGGAFLITGNLPARTREIVILRVARNTHSVYEYAQHRIIGQRADLSIDEIENLVAGPDLVGSWSDDEQIVIAMVDELCSDDTVNDATWAALAERYEDRDLVELLLLTGYYRMIAGFLNGARVQLDEGLEGWPE